jgi:hypothetical protein
MSRFLFLWDNSKLPWSVAVAIGGDEDNLAKELSKGGYIALWAAKPDLITLVIAGGDQSGHAYCKQPGAHGPKLMSREIERPQSWDQLLKQAEADLGPVPAVH